MPDIGRIADDDIEPVVNLEHPQRIEEGRAGVLIERVPGGGLERVVMLERMFVLKDLGQFVAIGLDQVAVFALGLHGPRAEVALGRVLSQALEFADARVGEQVILFGAV